MAVFGGAGVSRVVQGEFWRLVRSGATYGAAGVGAGVSVGLVRRWVRDGGGMPMVELEAPTGRFLSQAEREEIVVGLAEKLSYAEIARRLGRHRSTIGREVRRNMASDGSRRDARGRPITRYRVGLAQAKAEDRARRPKPAKLAVDHRLRWRVQARLRLLWSPEQIARSLRDVFPDRPELWVSHETIYQSLYVQGRGALRRELASCLRTGRAVRRPQRRPQQRRSRIPDPLMISERPAEAADRAVPGHWEGDLITGSQNKSAIGTLVERSTRYVMLLHLPHGHTAEHVQAAMLEAISTLPQHLWRSLTWDQGNEMARHREITLATDLPIYFCDPHSPWQRGSNENTNGLLRQYFPKGTDLSIHTAEHLVDVAIQLNGRPRKTLNWRNPAETLNQLLSNPYPNRSVATTT